MCEQPTRTRVRPERGRRNQILTHAVLSERAKTSWEDVQGTAEALVAGGRPLGRVSCCHKLHICRNLTETDLPLLR